MVVAAAAGALVWAWTIKRVVEEPPLHSKVTSSPSAWCNNNRLVVLEEDIVLIVVEMLTSFEGRTAEEKGKGEKSGGNGKVQYAVVGFHFCPFVLW